MFCINNKDQLAQLLAFKSGLEGGITVENIIARLADANSINPAVSTAWRLVSDEINNQSSPVTTLAQKFAQTGLFDPNIVMLVSMEGNKKIYVIDAAIEYVKSVMTLSKS